MKRGAKFIGVLLALSLMAGCATENYNPYIFPGAGLGAALGAGIGAAANHNNPWKGAAIGGLIGGAAGGIAGELYGRHQPYPYPQNPQSTYRPQTQGYYPTEQGGSYQ
ncbi:MAG: hypothetical protein FJ128_05555 [Deltaproteobacteria bacterium]|nr:hypothetical protein [Deltaproteobacteria bacterium]